MVLVKRISPLTGLENEMMLDITSEQVEEWNRPNNERRLIQDIFCLLYTSDAADE